MEVLTNSKIGSSDYSLNNDATLKKLQSAASKPAIEVTRNNGSTTIHFSTGAYVNVIGPLVKTWQRIEGNYIDSDLVDGMDISVDNIKIKKDDIGTIEHYKVKLAVGGQKVMVTCFDTTLTVLVQAGKTVLEPYCSRVLFPYLEHEIKINRMNIKEYNHMVQSYDSAKPNTRRQQQKYMRGASTLASSPRVRTLSSPGTPLELQVAALQSPAGRLGPDPLSLQLLEDLSLPAEASVEIVTLQEEDTREVRSSTPSPASPGPPACHEEIVTTRSHVIPDLGWMQDLNTTIEPPLSPAPSLSLLSLQHQVSLQPPLMPTPTRLQARKEANVSLAFEDEEAYISLGCETCTLCGQKCNSVKSLQEHIVNKHCNHSSQVLELLKMQQKIMNTILTNQSNQEKVMDKIITTQTCFISDIKELKSAVVSSHCAPRPAAPPVPAMPAVSAPPPVTWPAPPPAPLVSATTPASLPRPALDTAAITRRSASTCQPASITMANTVRQSVSEQADIASPIQHELQSCASSILFMGDSIFRNVYMEKIEKKARNKVSVVKAYSSAYDTNKNNKYKNSNFTDLVPKELNKAKYDAVVMQASSTDLTNYKTVQNKEELRKIAQSSNANMLSVATTAIANHPEVKKVVLFERVPRFDELQELNQFANKDLQAQWLQCDKEFKDKISIGKHNLQPHGKFANVQRLARWGDQTRRQKPDNIHMVGPSGKMKMTDSILAGLARFGIIQEAGPTGFFKDKSSEVQEWQQAGGRRQGRAPRRRQEEPFQLPLRNRYQQGNY